MKRYYLIFKGRVQGVGFRWTACQMAEKNRLTGWVKNLESGDVAVEIQGEEEGVNGFIADMYKAQGFIRIDDYFIKETKVKDNEKTFTPLI